MLTFIKKEIHEVVCHPRFGNGHLPMGVKHRTHIFQFGKKFLINLYKMFKEILGKLTKTFIRLNLFSGMFFGC